MFCSQTFASRASAGKLKDLFGKGSSSSSVDETTANVGTAESDSTATSSSAETSATAITKKEPISLEIDTKFPTIAPMSVAEKRAGRDRSVYPVLRSCRRPVLTDCCRLKAIDVEEASKRKRE